MNVQNKLLDGALSRLTNRTVLLLDVLRLVIPNIRSRARAMRPITG
ncbi:hypothetical protein SAMN05216417_12914 [Nitrosospira multiformis]|uniref:Uncharacterized protein n=1 Tax=Nitrosospira multiformis TaxID=1231 RepID=A0A1I7IWH1_9PROT|nr:hypothetical protein SAMN05216417_12914 [Nitrosospira multiformis]